MAPRRGQGTEARAGPGGAIVTKAVLALNAGSSSIKFALFEAAGEGDLRLVVKGSVDDTGDAPALFLSDRDEPLRIDPGAVGERRLEQLFAALFEAVEARLELDIGSAKP